MYVWNQWVFQHEAASGSNPLTTQQVFSLSQRVDLSQHNYTPFLNILALPLIPAFGVVASFNLVLLISSVLTALCTYALARLVFPVTRLEAFAAGLCFAWSPVLVTRTTGHFSLAAAAPLAAFLYFLIRADRTHSTRCAALAGLSMAWAAFCDPYFAVFCLMMTGLYVAAKVVRLSQRDVRSVPWTWLLDLLILSIGGLVIGLALGRGGRLEIWGVPISVRGLYTPVMALTMLVLLRLGVTFRPRLEGLKQQSWVLKFALIAGIACAGPLSPVLYGLGQRIADGRFVTPPILWRSGPRGVDLLAFFEPNPNHVVSRWLRGDMQFVPENPEYTAAASLVALVMVGLAVLAARFRPRAQWPWLTIGFMLLALGPFVVVAGANTYVPGPWAVLRYVPVIEFVRSPTRFAIVAALGLAILLAGALAALGQRWPERRRAIGWAACLLLAAELIPAPRPLFSATYSPLSDIIAADSRPVRVLNLPFGVRDGTSSAPNFVSRYQFEQTRHEKALIGGYLSRVSKRRLSGIVERFPTVGALVTMSEGRALSEPEARRFVEGGRDFVAAANVGYVLINNSRVTPQLNALAIEAFHLEAIATDGPVTLYRPGDLR